MFSAVTHPALDILRLPSHARWAGMAQHCRAAYYQRPLLGGMAMGRGGLHELAVLCGRPAAMCLPPSPTIATPFAPTGLICWSLTAAPRWACWPASSWPSVRLWRCGPRAPSWACVAPLAPRTWQPSTPGRTCARRRRLWLRLPHSCCCCWAVRTAAQRAALMGLQLRHARPHPQRSGCGAWSCAGCAQTLLWWCRYQRRMLAGRGAVQGPDKRRPPQRWRAPRPLCTRGKTRQLRCQRSGWSSWQWS